MHEGKTITKIECPQGHKLNRTYDDDMLRALADGNEPHFCDMCDKSWYPGEVEKDNIKRLLAIRA